MDNQFPRNNFETFIYEKNLGWDPDKKLLLCKRCNYCLGKSFARHLRSKHRESLSEREIELVLQKCFKEESIYRIKTDALLEPIAWLPVFDGYRCIICPYYAPSLYKIRFHCKSTHGDSNQMMNCKVQTLGVKHVNIYFGVQDVPVLDRKEPDNLEEKSQAERNEVGRLINLLPDRKELKLVRTAKTRSDLSVEVMRAFEILLMDGYRFH